MSRVKKEEKEKREEKRLLEIRGGGTSYIVIALIQCENSSKRTPEDRRRARTSLTSVTNSQPARLFIEKQPGRMSRVFKRGLKSRARESRSRELPLASSSSSFPLLFFLIFLSHSSQTDESVHHRPEGRRRRGTTKKKRIQSCSRIARSG